MSRNEVSNETAELALYVSTAIDRALPREVSERASFHILDTVAAMVSGSTMLAGALGRAWGAAQPTYEAESGSTIVGKGWRTSPLVAALCNGMAAHADESDDSHAESFSHPGCAVVPAALAAGEAQDISGEQLIRSVVAGYDVGCRVGRAIGTRKSLEQDASQRSTHALVGAFGASAAACVIHGLQPERVRYALSYTAQLSSGVTTWMRDTHHVEKAFVFGGMPASQGILAASLAFSGCDGIPDVFSGSPNWLDAVSDSPNRTELVRGLGKDFEILRGTLKKYSVGSPAQAAVEAIVEMISEGGDLANGVKEIQVRLPRDSAVIVNGRSMPSINVQYLVAGTLLDGAFSSLMAHDDGRMRNGDAASLIPKVHLIPDESLAGTREAIVTVTNLVSGHEIVRTRHVREVRGTPALPMTAGEVRAKAEDLMSPVIGKTKAGALCDLFLELEVQPSIRQVAARLNTADR